MYPLQHIKDIAIDETSVKVSDALNDFLIMGHGYDLEREFYIIHLGSPMDAILLEVGNSIIQLSQSPIL